MSENEPELQDFGIKPEDYDLYTGKGGALSNRALSIALWGLWGLFSAVGSIVIFIPMITSWNTQGHGLIEHVFAYVFAFLILIGLPSMLLAVIIGGIIVGFIDSAIVRLKRPRLLASPVASQIKLYEKAISAHRSNQEEARAAQLEAEQAQQEAERARQEVERAQQEAERARQRKLQEYWMSLSGVNFERELGSLYKNLGYEVEFTSSSGDQGIDLILRKNGKKTIVQCKRHQSSAGPAIARELYGSLVASKADAAVLACTGGFTRGVYEFVQGKPIALISSTELAKMGESVQHKMQVSPSNPPICPVPGCGKAMVSQSGRYGTFWGCPSFPNCRGTRQYQEP